MWSSSSSRRQSSRAQSSSQGSVRNTPPPPPPPPQPLDDNNMRDMSTRQVHSGRGVQLPQNEFGVLNEQLQRFGWEYIPNFFTGFVCKPLVREFYARLFFYFENGDKSRPAIISRVAGQEIILNKTHLSFLLGIPDDGECIFFKKSVEQLKNALLGVPEDIYYSYFLKNNYTGGKIGEKHIQDIFRNLNTFLEYDILPKAGTNNSVSKLQGFILYCFSINRKINLSYLIIMYIKNIIDNQTIGLGYGALLTQFFINLGINVNDFEHTPIMTPISQRTINLRNTHPFHMPPQPEPENQGEPENEPQEAHEQDPEDAYAQLGPDLYYDWEQNRWNY